VGVVHVQRGVVLPDQGGEGREVGRVAGHGVDAVHADDPRRGTPAEQPLDVLDVPGAEPAHRGAPGTGDHGRIVQRLVGADIHQQRSLSGQGRFGLASMRQQLEMAGGVWQLRSRPGQGTTVAAILPMAGAGRAAGSPHRPGPFEPATGGRDGG
jgi:hypothetical protein